MGVQLIGLEWSVNLITFKAIQSEFGLQVSGNGSKASFGVRGNIRHHLSMASHNLLVGLNLPKLLPKPVGHNANIFLSRIAPSDRFCYIFQCKNAINTQIQRYEHFSIAAIFLINHFTTAFVTYPFRLPELSAVCH